ncbi:DUF881 domain-containing protein [Janibacter sp. G56]|uniref:DUF881 domain-containing protein n=1 Tax=Janibacter sp. G56 TaxID=3418717 RepID=UPI003CFE7057
MTEPTRPARRVDESMTLLTSMLERPLDPGYQAAADQRVANGLPAATSWRSPTLVVTALVVGLLMGISSASLRASQALGQGARADLIAQVEARHKAADEQAAAARAMQDEIAEAEAKVGGGVSAADAAELARLRAVTSQTGVVGPGMTITLDNADGSGADADGDPRTGQDSGGTVLSKDLQIITNGLWEAGAEAIAINGQRLSSRSAIRFAGDAILVNFRPLTRPYVVSAIGDPKEMPVAFAAGAGGSYLTSLSSNYGVQTKTTTEKELTLPSSVSGTTRLASPADKEKTS